MIPSWPEPRHRSQAAGLTRAFAADDLNHLLLGCLLCSELGSGLRYAYSRLDTIDRKASELFRSFTWAMGLLGGVVTLLRAALSRPRPGDLAPLQIATVLGFVVLVPIARSPSA